MGALNKAIFTGGNSLLLALNIEDGGGHGFHGAVSFLKNWLCLPYAIMIALFSAFVIKLLVENSKNIFCGMFIHNRKSIMYKSGEKSQKSE